MLNESFIVVCQSPKPLANGTMVSNGATVNYTCDLGYTINGMTSRACASDGTGWSGVDPFCGNFICFIKKKCCNCCILHLLLLPLSLLLFTLH